MKAPKAISELRPVALTCIGMKNFEKLIKNEILSHVAGRLDPLQFAYQAGRGVEDAKLFILDKLFKHLETPASHARLFFADFSSAFNRMQPHLLIQRLSTYFDLPHQLSLLCLDFLTNRTQQVLVNGKLFDPLISNTGSPQGCVLRHCFLLCTLTAEGPPERAAIWLNSLMTPLSCLSSGGQSLTMVAPSLTLCSGVTLAFWT